MVEIPRSESYNRNFDRHYDKAEALCLICAKGIKNLDRAKWVHVVGGGTFAAEPGDPPEHPSADMGAQPVGPDCAKKHPELPYLKDR